MSRETGKAESQYVLMTQEEKRSLPEFEVRSHVTFIHLCILGDLAKHLAPYKHSKTATSADEVMGKSLRKAVHQ